MNYLFENGKLLLEQTILFSQQHLLLVAAIAITLFLMWNLGVYLSVFAYRRYDLKKLVDHASHYPNEQSKYVEIDGVKLHYIFEPNQNPSAPHILLLHGIAANIYCWRKVIPLLRPYYNVWALDLMGFGQSDKPLNKKYDAQTQAHLIEGFLKSQNIPKCNLVGSSMGAAIATQVAMDYPDLVERLVLVNAAYNEQLSKFDIPKFVNFGKVGRLAPLLLPFINRFTTARVLKSIYAPHTKFDDVDVSAYLKPYATKTDSYVAFIASFDILFDPHIWRKARELNTPTLLLWGEHDNLIPTRYARNLAQSLKNCRLETTDKAGHHPQEEIPEWVVEKIIAPA